MAPTRGPRVAKAAPASAPAVASPPLSLPGSLLSSVPSTSSVSATTSLLASLAHSVAASSAAHAPATAHAPHADETAATSDADTAKTTKKKRENLVKLNMQVPKCANLIKSFINRQQQSELDNMRLQFLTVTQPELGKHILTREAKLKQKDVPKEQKKEFQKELAELYKAPDYVAFKKDFGTQRRKFTKTHYKANVLIATMVDLLVDELLSVGLSYCIQTGGQKLTSAHLDVFACPAVEASFVAPLLRYINYRVPAEAEVAPKPTPEKVEKPVPQEKRKGPLSPEEKEARREQLRAQRALVPKPPKVPPPTFQNLTNRIFKSKKELLNVNAKLQCSVECKTFVSNLVLKLLNTMASVLYMSVKTAGTKSNTIHDLHVNAFLGTIYANEEYSPFLQEWSHRIEAVVSEDFTVRDKRREELRLKAEAKKEARKAEEALARENAVASATTAEDFPPVA